MGRVSVPLLAIMLSHRLPVIALVSHYLTNKLIGRGPFINQHRLLYIFTSISKEIEDYQELVRLSTDYACVDGLLPTCY